MTAWPAFSGAAGGDAFGWEAAARRTLSSTQALFGAPAVAWLRAVTRPPLADGLAALEGLIARSLGATGLADRAGRAGEPGEPGEGGWARPGRPGAPLDPVSAMAASTRATATAPSVAGGSSSAALDLPSLAEIRPPPGDTWAVRRAWQADGPAVGTAAAASLATVRGGPDGGVPEDAARAARATAAVSPRPAAATLRPDAPLAAPYPWRPMPIPTPAAAALPSTPAEPTAAAGARILDWPGLRRRSPAGAADAAYHVVGVAAASAVLSAPPKPERPAANPLRLHLRAATLGDALPATARHPAEPSGQPPVPTATAVGAALPSGQDVAPPLPAIPTPATPRPVDELAGLRGLMQAVVLDSARRHALASTAGQPPAPDVPYAKTSVQAAALGRRPATPAPVVLPELDALAEDLLVDRLLDRLDERLRDDALRHLGLTGGLI